MGRWLRWRVAFFLALGVGGAGYAAPYGLTERPVVAPFLGNRLPQSAPSAATGWSIVPAFPNLSFRDPVFLTPEPNSSRLYLGTLWGVIHRFANDPLTANSSVFLDLSGRTQVSDNSGLYAMVFHPEYGKAGSPNRGYVYVYYQYSANPIYGYRTSFNRLSRFTVPDGSTVADPASEQILIHQYDPHVWHNGGGLCFGSDGFLYLSLGQAGGSRDYYNTTQRIDAGLFSGVLRIDVNRDPAKSHPIRRQPRSIDPNVPSFTANYFVPNDNPFVDQSGAVLEEFWALGFRSPHRMTCDPVTGQLWLGDVGENRAEEVNIVRKGGNYGWAFREGLDAGPKPRPAILIGTEIEPAYWYYGGDGNNSIIGGYVYRGREHAAFLDGWYIFGDNGSGRVWALSPADGHLVFLANLPGSGLTGLSSFGTDQSGEVYLLKLGAAGQIFKIVRGSSGVPAPPSLLSQTGAFANTATLTPAPGLIPYGVNSPLWSDNANKIRWAAIPNDGAPYGPGEVISFAAQGPWAFPAGSVFVKHFELPVDETNPAITRRLETRLLVRDTTGGVYGLTYKWRPDGSDADLLAGSLSEDISVRTATGTRTQTWFYPSQQACLSCHAGSEFQVLGVNTRQLNGNFRYPSSGITDNQLRTWNQLGLFSTPLDEASIPAQERVVAVSDASAPLETRVRSYIDANCAHCHHPNSGRGFFDARFQTPLSEQGIIDGPLATSLGGPDARVLAPGSVERSLMHYRMNTVDDTRMPPLARNVVDVRAVATLEQWIELLRPVDALPAPWTSRDVGTVLYDGAVSYSSGSFTVNGAGADIWGAEDGFHFMSQPWSGDGEIVARVASVQDTDVWAKAGVMFRESLSAGAQNAFMLFRPDGGAFLQHRVSGATSTVQTAGPTTVPGWLKLVRTGSAFTGYVSDDGATWNLVGTATLALPQTIHVGLAVTSHNPTTLCAARFDNVRVGAVGGPAPPATPGNLVATAISSSRIDLAWQDNSTMEGGFGIERSSGGSAFQEIGTVGANVTAFSNTGLVASTAYTYRVRALSSSGNSSYSNSAAATTLAGEPPPPPAGWLAADVGAVGLAGSQDMSGTPMTVRGSGGDIWGSADAFRFVYQALSGDGAIQAQVTGVTNTDAWAKAGVMIRESLAANARNTFVFVAAVNGLAAQNRATLGGATTSTPGPWGITPPYWVRLVRTGNTLVASASPDGASWTTVATHTVSMGADVLVGLAVTSHNNAALCTGTFANVSFTGGGSPPPPPPPTPPNAPTGLTASAASASQINLTWTDASTNESGFEVERSTDNVTFTLRTTTAANAATFADTGLTADTIYYYRVRAVNAAGASTYSNVANARTASGTPSPGPPSAPTNLTATAAPASQINLGWTDTSTNESGFEVERSTDNVTFTLRTTTGANVATFADTGLTAATTYYYRVRAIGATGASTFSNVATATTAVTSSTAPSNLVATAVSSTRIDLTWTDNASNEDGFRIERASDGTTFTQVATTSPNVVTYSDAGVSGGVTYTYRVRAMFGLSNSAYSNLASATPSAGTTTWTFADIGAVGVAGSNSSTANTITINGAGADIWDAADAFRFVYRSVTGDGVVEARVIAMQNTHGWAKAGVMIRESLAPNSRNAFAFLTPVQHGMSGQARTEPGGSTTSVYGPARNAPYWVRLTRAGNIFTAASSPDGVVWTNYASFTMAMSSTVYFGFAVTSHDNTQLNTAVFEDPFVQ